MNITTTGPFDELRRQIQGDLLLPQSSGYDHARTLWNAMIDKHPAAIARCTSVADVVAAVDFCRERKVAVAVRGGGHNIAGNALCDGGLVIDLSRLRTVQIDAAARRALVAPGATLGDIDRASQLHGLVVPTGINSTTGIAGLTLGGGFGWLTRRLGMTIDHLVSAEIVAADGRTLRASADVNADLFWALRGGGGNFGVVTNFEFQLHPVGPEIFAGLIVFPLAEAKAVLQKYREFMTTAPAELNVWAILRQAPALPFLPVEVHGRGIVALAVFYSGDPGTGRQLVEPLRNFARPDGEHLGIQTYTDWQQVFDPLLAAGARNYWKSHNLAELKDGLIETVLAHAAELPFPQCEIFVATLGGAAARVAADATAYGNRDANFVINVHGRWENPQEDQAGIGWARSFFEAAAPYSTGGVYVNFMPADETARIPAAYGTNFARLRQIKAKYDPANLFHHNQNIRPATAA